MRTTQMPWPSSKAPHAFQTCVKKLLKNAVERDALLPHCSIQLVDQCENFCFQYSSTASNGIFHEVWRLRIRNQNITVIAGLFVVVCILIPYHRVNSTVATKAHPPTSTGDTQG